MKISMNIIVVMVTIGLSAQDLTQNYRKLILNSPNSISLFQSNSTNGIWASGMITADRWGVFEDATSTKEHLTILSGGNVGIGNSNPLEKLQIANSFLFHDGGHKVLSFLYQLSNGGTDMDATKYAGEVRFNPTNGNLRFGTSTSITDTPTTRMTIDKIGNIGIGTTNPIAAIEINRNINGSVASYLLNPSTTSNSRSIFLLGEGATGGNYGYLAHHSANYTSTWGDYTLANATYLVGNDTNGLGIMAGNSQGKIVFGTGSSEKMRLIANGNFGIGTTIPDAKLAVKGQIHAEEVKVDLSVPGPDYVFKQDYDLRTLREIQSYIKENGHLPNIPSAKEMEKDGIELGIMNMKLLEKIEELTLYILQQEQKLEKERQINQKQEIRLKKIEQLLNPKK